MQNSKSKINSDQQWYVIGREHRYGPYNVKQMICLFYRGILKSRHICESIKGDSATVQHIFNEFKKNN